MNNFEYHNPTRIVFGKNSIQKISSLIPPKKSVVLLYGGGSIKANGVYDQVKHALGSRISLELGGIPANPEYDILMDHAMQIESLEDPFLLAVGGGSVLDGVKFIAAAVHYEGDPWDMVSKGAPVKHALPLGAILTLPATGSEANEGAVISRRSKNQKLGFGSPLLFPVFSILDPETTYSLPTKQTANGIVDTWVHVCEQYLTRDLGTLVQDSLAVGILNTLKTCGLAVLRAPKDYHLRANLMHASTWALNGLLGTGTQGDWSTHLIGHELTALYGLDHAQSLAVVLPGVLQYKKQAKFDKLLHYAREVWGLHQGDELVLVDEAIARTILFFESLGVGTRLRDYGLGPEAADAVAKSLEARGYRGGEDGDITSEVANAILLSRA